MKYRVELTREDGKRVLLAANEYIDIDVFDGNERIAALTVRYGKVVNDNNEDIGWLSAHYNMDKTEQ